MMQNTAKLEQLTQKQLKTSLELKYLKVTLKTADNRLAAIEPRLKTMEDTLIKKEVEDKTRSAFLGYIKQALPLLWGLCAAMLVLGLTLDDLHLVKLILGQNS